MRVAVFTLSLSLGLAGCTCSAPAARIRPVDPPAAAGSAAVNLSHESGRTIVSWIEPARSGNVLRYSEWKDGAWTSPKHAVQHPGLVVDATDAPSVVALEGGGLAGHWTVKTAGASWAHDLETAVAPEGTDWRPAVRPHHDGTASEHGYATIVPDPDLAGAFDIVWLDGRAAAAGTEGGATQLRHARFEQGAYRADEAIDLRVCDCCKTAAVRGRDGAVVVAYRDRDEADTRDISVVTGRTGAWSMPAPVHADGWRLTACPTNGPALVAAANTLVAVWFTAGGGPRVQAAVSRDGGATFAAPVRLDAAAAVGRVDAAPLDDGSVAVVWVEKTPDRGELRARRLAPDGTAAEPVVVSPTDAGRKGGIPRVAPLSGRDVLVAWADTGPAARVRAAVVTLP